VDVRRVTAEMTGDTDWMAHHLARAMEEPLGGRVEVRSVERLKGGYSRRMWAFEAAVPGEAASAWILCTDAADGVVGVDSLSRAREAALLRHLHRGGLPVPAIAASGTGPEPFGAPWFVMRRLPGTASVGPLLRDPEITARRPELGRQKAEILARIHRATIPADALGPVPGPATIATDETRRWSRAMDQTPDAGTDTMRSALSWLGATTPTPPTRVCIVHGDYRTGNLLYDRSGITGVLDWEMAHPGDALEDVAWAQLASWRIGTGLVGALLTDDEWIGAYQTASDRSVDHDDLRFWRVLTGVKMSLLAWRAYERTPPGAEKDLLHALFSGLQAQLGENLA
jgi:aminoglycoside phosphotransferase (APT) family kinase protein